MMKNQIQYIRKELDLSPSVWEVDEAKRIFMARIERDLDCTQYPPGSPNYMSPEILLACACAAVWQAGRKWQRDNVVPVLEVKGGAI